MRSFGWSVGLDISGQGTCFFIHFSSRCCLLCTFPRFLSVGLFLFLSFGISCVSTACPLSMISDQSVSTFFSSV
ncbi:hypothetical protein K505DRAFT_2057 [Melanomma pulvis-pyrius CBS 109.77]|uniref:Uncharacterized protein n=1 Tax=Melanomma pulvis-pyrius CBS 109.77 TaxID=1314802 RepID=A0A6A6XJ21_9PLEO|nr:hypothetical protein K505DRAFT_2057 [Melanomma pulvis-pyrius CBS 109.77]